MPSSRRRASSSPKAKAADKRDDSLFEWTGWPEPESEKRYMHRTKPGCFVLVEMLVGRAIWRVYARNECCLGRGMTDALPAALDKAVPIIERTFVIEMAARRWT